MNIMHLNSQLQKGGGLEKILMDLCLNSDHKNNYLCVINEKWSKEYIELLNPENVLLCNRKEGDKNPVKNIAIIRKIILFLKRNKIDIIHCHDKFSIKVAYYVKKIFKSIKIVFTIHDTQIFNQKLSRYEADKYVAISEVVFKQINQWIPKEKIDLIYNGVNLEKYFNSKKVKSDNLEKNKMKILCVARVVPEVKGQDILIKALHILKEKYSYDYFECNFAGGLPKNFETSELYSKIKDFNLNEQVNFLGNVSNTEELYANSDLFILPSRHEGFGIVLVEALASECIVISSNNKGPMEILKNDKYGLSYEVENSFELAEKIIKIKKDFELYKKSFKTKNVKKYLNDNYTLEKMLYKYDQVYSGFKI